MKKIMKRIFAFILCVSLLLGGLPVSTQAASTKEASKGYVELNDGYLSVKVSEKNGGFLVDTVEGDKLNKSDNNKFLLYPDENYDTSFTSFRVTRDGRTKDYIFGRNYSFWGLGKNDITVKQVSENEIVSTWSVDGLEFTQTLSLLDTKAQQHGMVYITYSVKNTTDNKIDDIQARIMMDTALGYQDYAVYMAGQADGSYTTVKTERTMQGNEYSNYFFAYDDEYTPGITAYTLNASVGGKTIVPEKVTFAHWNNLAASVFDYEPVADYTQSLNFTNPYNEKYMTADSATALYYDMGSAEAGEDSTQAIGVYYGVYSNAEAGDTSVALNFAGPADMILNETETGYVDLNGDAPGNFTLTTKVQNTSDKALDYIAVTFSTPEKMVSFDTTGSQNTTSVNGDPYYIVIRNLQPGEVRDVTLNYLAEPMDVSDYRKIKVQVFDISKQVNNNQITLLEEDKLVSRDSYILCPSVEGESVSFLSTNPEVIYVNGTRHLYLTGKNFGLLRNTDSYRVVLRPANGAADVVVPSSNVIINTEDNTADLVLDQYLSPGTWNVIIDWVDTGIMDITTDALRFVVSDKEMYKGGSFGVLTISTTGDGTIASPCHYDLNVYRGEEEYEKATGGKARKDVLLVLRGDFTLKYDDNNKLIGAEAVAIKGGDAISLNECLDVTEGRLTVSIEYDENGNQTCINTDIDGKVYTTGANTLVWDGVCAISSFEEGELVKFPVYKYNGELSTFVEDQTANTNMLYLTWPGAASTAQTIAGMIMELRYAQFAIMATEAGGEPDKYVVSFGAELSPDFLVPNNFDYGTVQTSALDQVQLKIAKSNYTADQLREVEATHKKDLDNWGKADGGGLNLKIKDILFGGGFVGLNTSIEVGLPSYTDGMPKIEGTLYLKVMNEEWGVGINGKADFLTMNMEAEFACYSKNGIPVPDKIRFFVGGFVPGIPLDPMGIFWVRGAGAGIDKMYETFFVSSTIPPLTLMLSGEFAIFEVLSARADLSLSARGISGYLKNISVAEIEIMDSIGGKVYWYPRLDLGLGMKLSILDVINGEGSIILQQIPYDGEDEWFWQAYATASVEIPQKYPIIGGIEIAAAEFGVDYQKIFGAIHVIKLDAGVVYYWGGDVDFAFGKYDVPEATMPTPFALRRDADTGRTLYMAATNMRLLGRSRAVDVEETIITSSKDMCTHTFTLDGNAGEDAMIHLTFPVENNIAAQVYKNQIKVLYEESSVEKEYKLEWLDANQKADASANEDANAIYNYDAENKMVSVAISVTEAEQFNVPITIETPKASEITLYGLSRMADLNTITVSDDKQTATITGEKLGEMSQLKVYAVDANKDAWLLAEVPVTTLPTDPEQTVISNIDLRYPSNLPSGDYTIQAVGVVKDETGTEVANPIVETEITYTNPKQPAAPTQVEVTLGGDYTIDVTPTASGDFDGYYVTIYEQTSLFEKEVTIYKDLMLSKNNRVHTVGGQYEVPIMDEDGQPTDKTQIVGLEAGKRYVVGVSTYKKLADDSILLSEEKQSTIITMVESKKAEPKFEITGSVAIETAGVLVDTIGSEDVTVHISGVDTVKNGSYTLNDGEKKEWKGGDISFSDLANGVYVLSVVGENANGDSFGEKYQFAVDVKEPRIMISSPVDGFFRGDSLIITGLSEAGSKITAMVKGDTTLGRAATQSVTANTDENGRFVLTVPMNMSLYQQNVQLFAVDAVGNQSRKVNLYMVNALVGSEDAEAVLLADGQEAKTILANGEDVQLEMAIKVDDQIIRLNNMSMAAAMVDYQLTVYEGDAEVDTDGVFNGSTDTVGMVRATLNEYEVAARIVGASMEDATVTITIPEGGYVYDETAKEPPVESVVLNGLLLKEGRDYTVSYANNIAAGNANVVIEAIADSGYLGVKVVDFTIAKATIDKITPSVTAPVEGKTPQEKVNISGCNTAEIKWTYNGKAFKDKFVAGEEYIATITLVADSNHTFAENVKAEGWKVTANADGTWTLVRNYTAVTKSGDEQVETHLITFIANNKVVATRVVEHGGTLTDIPEIPEKIGYMQTKPVWSVTDFRNIRKDMTVHAIYTPDVYTITFVIDDKVVKTMEVGYMDTVEGKDFPEIPEKMGYTDTEPKWDKSAVRDVTEDVTVTAIYTPNLYSIQLPDNMLGYTITLPHDEILYGEDFSFTITLDKGYNADDVDIILNGVVINKKYLTIKDNQILVRIPAEEVTKFFGEEGRSLDIEVSGIVLGTGEKADDFSWLWIILVILIITVVVVYYYKKRNKK
ncbi:MAG: hypothetical protein IJA07_09855 [Agathobacter sp.]|nr:hypothetical protein [Agathobacter sp.]